MNKVVFITIFILILTSWACQQEANTADLVTTIHPFAQIIQPLLGDELKILALMPPGASPHTFRLKPSQIKLVEQARILFLGHENLDRWAYGIPAQNKIELLSLIPDENILFFDDSMTEIDPHFWTDPLTVKALLPALVRKLAAYLPEYESELHMNMIKFSTELDSLHLQLKNQLAPLSHTVVLLSHPFFRYFLLRYGFEIGYIIESHAGQTPTPQTVRNIIKQLPRMNVRIILTHLNHSDNIARVVGQSAGIPICVLDPLGSEEEINSYGDILKFNTNKIVEALH